MSWLWSRVTREEKNGATIVTQHFGAGEFDKHLEIQEAQAKIARSVATQLAEGNGDTRLVAQEAINHGIQAPTASDYGKVVIQFFMESDFWKNGAFEEGLSELNKGKGNMLITLLQEAFASEFHNPDLDIRGVYEKVYSNMLERTAPEKKSQLSISDIHIVEAIEKTFSEAEIVVRRKIRHLLAGALAAIEAWIVDPTQQLSLQNRQAIRRIESEWNDFCVESSTNTLDGLVEIDNVTKTDSNPVIKLHRRFILAKKNVIAQAKAFEESVAPQRPQEVRLQSGLKGMLTRALEKLLSKIK